MNCEDVHKITSETDCTEVNNHLYFNSIFNSPDDSLYELREIDPGLKILPKFDRKIFSLNKSFQFNLLLSNLFPELNILDYSKIDLSSEEIINNLRRRFYFEGDFDKLVETFEEIENYYDLLPYSFLKKYLKNLRREGNLNLLKQDVSKGIAQLEGIRDTELAKNNIMIKITQNSKE